MIYELANDPSKVAKIYHQTPSTQKVTKLKHLRSLASKNLLEVAAWPTGLLFESSHPQTARGFLMPLVKGKEFSAAAKIWEMLEPVRGHNMAKSALETAIWDAEAKRKGVPLMKLDHDRLRKARV